MKYIKQYDSLRDDWENADNDKKIELALQALDKMKSMETDFEIGDYVKFREEYKKTPSRVGSSYVASDAERVENEQVLYDYYIVTKIIDDNRPKKYRDKIQSGYMTNVRTGKNGYYQFQHFENCTKEEIKNIQVMLDANKYNI